MARIDRVLYVDDDDTARAAFLRAMRHHGIEAHVAKDAWRAMRLAKRFEYAVIAVDYEMPGLDGFEAAEELRAMQPDATYLLISGRVDLDVALEAVNEHGMTYVVPKPWNVDELATQIKRGTEAAWERVAHRKVAAGAVDLNRRFEEQQRGLRAALAREGRGVTHALLASLGARDPNVEARGRRVAAVARLIGEQLGLDREALATLDQGALLRDLGMIGVPSSVTEKPGALDAGEWAILKTHPLVGAQLLGGVPELEAAREIVLQHHERWDGEGYPRGLAGEEICLGARIVAVAETLDAVLSERPYRRAVSYQVAREVLDGSAGTQLDPAVVEVLLRIPGQRVRTVRDEACPPLRPGRRAPPPPPIDP